MRELIYGRHETFEEKARRAGLPTCGEIIDTPNYGKRVVVQVDLPKRSYRTVPIDDYQKNDFTSHQLSHLVE